MSKFTFHYRRWGLEGGREGGGGRWRRRRTGRFEGGNAMHSIKWPERKPQSEGRGGEETTETRVKHRKRRRRRGGGERGRD